MPGAGREAGHKFDVVSLAPLKRRRIQDTGYRQQTSLQRGAGGHLLGQGLVDRGGGLVVPIAAPAKPAKVSVRVERVGIALYLPNVPEEWLGKTNILK